MKRSFIPNQLFVFLIIAVPWLLLSEEFTLDKALDFTLKTNPALKAARLRVQAGLSLVKQAGVPPNPAMEVELEDFGRGEAALVFSQDLELGGKRGMRVNVAESETEIARLELTLSRAELLAETAARYVDFWMAREKVRLWQQGVGIADSVLKVIIRRVGEGAGPEIEKIRAEVELGSARRILKSLEREAAAALAGLTALWGGTRPDFAGAATPPVSPEKTLDTAQLFGRIKNCPALALGEVRLKRHEAEILLARAEGVTDMGLAAGIKREGESKSTMAVLGLSMKLPLFNRNRGAVAAAVSNRDASRFDRQAAEAAIKGRIAALAASHAAKRFEYADINSNSLPGMKKAFEEGRRLYLRGRTTYLELLDIQRTLLELRIARLETLAEINKITFEIASLLGSGPGEELTGGK